MNNLKVSILHFQPIERYPPVLNLLNCLSKKNYKADVYTTSDRQYQKNVYKSFGIKINRNGEVGKVHSSLKRYLQYIKFNVKTIVQLIINRPQKILFYETLSVFPAYIYKKIFKSSKIYIHYHEYSSLYEISNSSRFFKWLNSKEIKLFPLSNWISHTNELRMELFLNDYSKINFNRLEIIPNYPPASWYGTTSAKCISFPLKFVYVGALSMNTMYAASLFNWVHSQQGNITLSIYSGNCTADVIEFLEKLNSCYITFNGEVDYFALPQILVKYDIGVIIYNGHIPNYVFNAPNKLFEYHACGLDVWFPSKLIGSLSLITTSTYPQITAVDFDDLGALDIKNLIDRNAKKFRMLNFTAEDVFSPVIKELNGI